jgi:hypothetical protein
VSEGTADETGMPEDHPPAEELLHARPPARGGAPREAAPEAERAAAGQAARARRSSTRYPRRPVAGVTVLIMPSRSLSYSPFLPAAYVNLMLLTTGMSQFVGGQNSTAL